MALSREQVVSTAIRLLDEVGLERLTLRRLAAELGVQAPTLYWHVRDKRALLDLMSLAIVRESYSEDPLEPRPGQPWWEWLAERATRRYHALLRHRDAALVVAGNRPTEEGLPMAERVVGSLVAVGFPPGEALGVFMVMRSYVMGCALEYQAEAARALRPERDRELWARLTEGHDLPYLSAAVAELGPHTPPGGGAGRHAQFEHGLDLLIAGLRDRHRMLTAAAVPAGEVRPPATSRVTAHDDS